MSGLVAVYRRELIGLFYAPLAWVLLGIVLVLDGAFVLVFLREVRGDIGATMQFVLGGSYVFWAIMLFVPPLLTMRMISEEARTGILEFLLTAPVTDFAVVTGKFLAAVTFMTLLWLAVPVYGVTLELVGTSPDWPPILGGLVGALLTSALFCAIGLVASACTNTPLMAAFLALVFNLGVLLLPLLGGLTELDWVHRAITSVDVMAHFQRSFMIGVLDSSQVVFFVSWTALFLFFAVRLVETRRWR